MLDPIIDHEDDEVNLVPPLVLDAQARGILEAVADNVESIAMARLRDKEGDQNLLMQAAWDIKQVARRGTPSEGI